MREILANLLAAAVCVLLAAYYAGMETGAYCLNRMRLRYRKEHNWKSARILFGLLQDPEGLLCATLVGYNLFVFLGTAIVTGMLEASNVRAAELISTLCLAPILLVFADMTPKNIFQRQADRLMYPLAATMSLSRTVFSPVVFLLKGITRVVGHGKDAERDPFFTPERLHYLIAEGTEEGVISSYQSMMARNILRLDETPLSRVMIPIKDATAIPKSISTEQLRKTIAEKRFSRFPVYDGRRDNVVGVLNILEFLWTEDANKTCEDLMRPPLYLKKNMPIDDALVQLQKAKQPMGIVVNEMSRALGIVTIKDIVEEIVGELEAW